MSLNIKKDFNLIDSELIETLKQFTNEDTKALIRKELDFNNVDAEYKHYQESLGSNVKIILHCMFVPELYELKVPNQLFLSDEKYAEKLQEQIRYLAITGKPKDNLSDTYFEFRVNPNDITDEFIDNFLLSQEQGIHRGEYPVFVITPEEEIFQTEIKPLLDEYNNQSKASFALLVMPSEKIQFEYEHKKFILPLKDHESMNFVEFAFALKQELIPIFEATINSSQDGSLGNKEWMLSEKDASER